MESITWLETFLLNYNGSVIIVAHDRYFLDRVVTKVIELDNSTASSFFGNYSTYAQKKAMLFEALMKQYLNQQREIKHQEEVITKLRSFNREKSIKRAESREKLLNKIDVIEKPQTQTQQMSIQLEPRFISGNDVLSVSHLSKSFGTQRLFSDLNFEIKRGERVAIIGNNGTGKTTILKIINQLLEADAGEIKLGAKVHIGYYDQEHQVLHLEKTIFQEIQDAYPSLTNTEIRNVLAAFLFTNDDVFKQIKDFRLVAQLGQSCNSSKNIKVEPGSKCHSGSRRDIFLIIESTSKPSSNIVLNFGAKIKLITTRFLQLFFPNSMTERVFPT